MGLRIHAIFVVLAGLLAVPASAAVAVYTERGAWEAAMSAAGVTSLTTDSFDENIPAAFTIALHSGVLSKISSEEDYPSSGGLNRVSGGLYHNGVGDGAEASQFIDWQFPKAIRGFGADWFNTATGSWLSVKGNFSGSGTESVNISEYLADPCCPGLEPGSGFLGFVGSVDFTSVRFVPLVNELSEFFEVDNLAFGNVAPIPLPGGLLLMLAGLGGLGIFSMLQRAD
jgi:hypothetical protein